MYDWMHVWGLRQSKLIAILHPIQKRLQVWLAENLAK
jgi:hypothetical protein